jgi:hypothetical protein
LLSCQQSADHGGSGKTIAVTNQPILERIQGLYYGIEHKWKEGKIHLMVY